MTDKEIIEIDGINVLECEHYQYKSLKDCEMRYPESGDCEIGLLNYLFDGNLDMEKLCKDNPNCYFKQLQRKEQECEKLKIQLMQKDEVNMFFNTPIEGWSNDPCGICPYKAENEELKKELNGSEEWRIKAESLNEKLDIKNTRYHKALEEIEKVINNILNSCLGRNTVSCRPAHNVCGDLINILDIISRAKGGRK